MLREKQEEIMNECTKKKQRINELKRQIREKHRILEESNRKREHVELPTGNNNAVIKAWQRIHLKTVESRRILVKEVCSLFELRPGVIEESEILSTSPNTNVELPPFSPDNHHLMEAKEDLYICGVTLPTRLIDVSKYPKEELNAPVGLVIHMLGLIIRYLGIKLPFMIFQKGIRPYIRMIAPNTQLWTSTRKMPLFLEDDDKNFKKFVVAMAMLNYNLAYLCFTQGVNIPVSQVANTLESLMLSCKAPKLGIQSHALYYQGIRDIEFPIEFQQVLRATTLRFRCSSLLEIISNNELNDKYFKVRSMRKRMDSDEEEEEIYLDSDDDDDDADDSQPKQVPHSTQSETWSLVEVAPFL